MEINYFLARIAGLIISFLALWGASKLLKFKRNRSEHAFLFVAIMFVLGSILELFFIYAFNLSILTLLLFVVIIAPIGIFLWFYLLKKIYKIKFMQSLKVAGILFLIGLITSLLISLFFSYESPYDFPSSKEMSCRERYNTFPLSMLDEETKKQDLLTCLTNQAIEENNSLICEQTSDTSSCYSRYAHAKLDEFFCERLNERSQYFCYTSIAKEKNDLSICKNLPDYGNTHYGSNAECKAEVVKEYNPDAIIKGEYCTQHENGKHSCYPRYD